MKRKVDTEAARRQYLKGAACLRAEQYEKAITHFRSAIKFDPLNAARAWNSLGVALRGLKRPDEAVGAFRAAEKLDLAYAHPRFNLAIIQRDRGDIVGALRLIRDALKVEPELKPAQNEFDRLSTRLVKAILSEPDVDGRAEYHALSLADGTAWDVKGYMEPADPETNTPAEAEIYEVRPVVGGRGVGPWFDPADLLERIEAAMIEEAKP